MPGYVTEKIVNAFLAGSIPIYWGSRAVLEIFNPESFIYANAIQVRNSFIPSHFRGGRLRPGARRPLGEPGTGGGSCRSL